MRQTDAGVHKRLDQPLRGAKTHHGTLLSDLPDRRNLEMIAVDVRQQDQPQILDKGLDCLVRDAAVDQHSPVDDHGITGGSGREDLVLNHRSSRFTVSAGAAGAGGSSCAGMDCCPSACSAGTLTNSPFSIWIRLESPT